MLQFALYIILLLGAAASVVSSNNHNHQNANGKAQEECCADPVCGPGDPSPPCPPNGQ